MTNHHQQHPSRVSFALFALIGCVMIGALSGCEHRYEALTAPPPGLTAALNDDEKTIRISLGVALGFECFNQDGDPCSRESSASDPAVARILPAHLDTVTGNYRTGPQTRSAFVVVGITEGRTEVSAGGDSLAVTVLPAGTQ
jgi:hypothetical protein